MTTESLIASLTIPSPPEVVFGVLADPTTHAAISGGSAESTADRTGWIEGAVDTEPITAAGQVFRMGMFHPNHPDGSYRTANQVREFDPPRAILWATGTEDDEGRLSFGGWTWRYDLLPADGGATEVRLTYDWSEATEQARRIIGFPPFGVDHLQNSLGRLAGVVADRDNR